MIRPPTPHPAGPQGQTGSAQHYSEKCGGKSGPLENKIYADAHAAATGDDGANDLVAWLSPLPRPLVFTNGCFDILHRGHVDYLQTAANLGASLVVALNSDASVQRLGKDASRPINPLADRLAVVAALASVDAVIAFAANTPLALITQLRPEILVKGADWAVADIVGGPQVQAWGGEVRAIDCVYARSTTALLQKIRAAPVTV